MEIAEKEVGLLVFDTDILNNFFLSVAEITSRLMGKIGTHRPAAKELNWISFIVHL